VRLFSLHLATDDAYFLVSRLKDADKPEVTAITQWTVGQFCNNVQPVAQHA
jgi:hypothetical protein